MLHTHRNPLKDEFDDGHVRVRHGTEVLDFGSLGLQQLVHVLEKVFSANMARSDAEGIDISASSVDAQAVRAKSVEFSRGFPGDGLWHLAF